LRYGSWPGSKYPLEAELGLPIYNSVAVTLFQSLRMAGGTGAPSWGRHPKPFSIPDQIFANLGATILRLRYRHG
jgi:hypothetical protein